MKMKYIKKIGKIFLYVCIGLIGGMGGSLDQADSNLDDKEKR